MTGFMTIAAGLLILIVSLLLLCIGVALLLLCGTCIALMISIAVRIWDNHLRPWLDKNFGESD